MHLPCSCKLPLELLLLLDTISFATTTRNIYDYCYCFHHHPLPPRGVFLLFDAFLPNEKPSSKIGQIIKALLSKKSSRFSLYNAFFLGGGSGASGRSDSSIEGRTPAAEGCTGAEQQKHQITRLEGPKPLLQSCACVKNTFKLLFI